MCEFYLQEFYQLLTVNTGEKYPPVSDRGRGKVIILKLLEHSVLLNKVCSQKKLFARAKSAGVNKVCSQEKLFARAKSVGISSETKPPGRGEISNSSPL